MSKPHMIDLDEMLSWIEDNEETYAADSRANKSLVVKMRGGYRVQQNGKTVYDGTDGRSAVEAYNALR